MGIDVRFINPFITSSRQVFDQMIHLPMKLGQPYLKRGNQGDFMISAAIGLSGAVTGSIILCFSQPVALALAGGFMGAPCKAIDEECIDALGEITNIVAGSAKKDLPGGMTELSLPHVILGAHKIKYPSGVPIIVLPCHTDVGEFVIEVAIRPSADAAPAAKTT